MDDFKKQIQRKLIAGIIIDKCTHCEGIIFRDAWCTQERVIRFTTPFFRELFGIKENESGKWKTGDVVMYEAYNDVDSFIVKCVMDASCVRYTTIQQEDNVLKAFGLSRDGSQEYVLKSWDLTSELSDTNKLFEGFDSLLNKKIPKFEKKLEDRLRELSEEPQLREGEVKRVVLTKYERNPKARAACIAAHGTACAVCGIDFGKAYGSDFEGMIEVHHLVPLSEIGEEYVVDPVNDLIPVCPNCHTLLHSKKDGVYTVEELRAMLKDQN